MKPLDEIKQLKAYGSAAGLKPETPSRRKKCHGLRMALISAGVSLAGGFYFAEKNSANASEPSAVLEDRSGTAAVQSQPVENHGRQGKAETHSGPGRDTGGSENKEPVAVKGSWKTSDMPEKHETFFISRTISPEQMEILRRGHVPKEMEDKWFWYMEGDTLFAHRAWTGYCIFRIDFSTAGDHRVTVNRDIRQYRCTSIKEDKKTLNDLLDWWTRSPYDYYGEWLSETASAIESEKRQNGSQVEKTQKDSLPGANRSGARRVRGVGGLVAEAIPDERKGSIAVCLFAFFAAIFIIVALVNIFARTPGGHRHSFDKHGDNGGKAISKSKEPDKNHCWICGAPCHDYDRHPVEMWGNHESRAERGWGGGKVHHTWNTVEIDIPCCVECEEEIERSASVRNKVSAIAGLSVFAVVGGGVFLLYRGPDIDDRLCWSFASAFFSGVLVMVLGFVKGGHKYWSRILEFPAIVALLGKGWKFGSKPTFVN